MTQMKGSQQRRSASHTGGFSHGGTRSVSSAADAIVASARKRMMFIVEVWVVSVQEERQKFVFSDCSWPEIQKMPRRGRYDVGSDTGPS
jgi:hypothetical protein